MTDRKRSGWAPRTARLGFAALATATVLSPALGDAYSDAFYLLGETGGVTTPTRPGFWDLAVDAAPINGIGSQEAANRIVGPIPASPGFIAVRSLWVNWASSRR